MQKVAQPSYETKYGEFVLYTRSLAFCLAKELSPFTILTSIKLLKWDKGYYRHRYYKKTSSFLMIFSYQVVFFFSP